MLQASSIRILSVSSATILVEAEPALVITSLNLSIAIRTIWAKLVASILIEPYSPGFWLVWDKDDVAETWHLINTDVIGDGGGI